MNLLVAPEGLARVAGMLVPGTGYISPVQGFCIYVSSFPTADDLDMFMNELFIGRVVTTPIRTAANLR
jgi:hypothetical protein